MKFLVVDDDLINRRLLGALLSKYGECDFAVDGGNSVDCFRESIVKDKPFDIVFMDIMMPEMNGHDALKHIRNIEEKKGIQLGNGAEVVMVTALSDRQNVLSAFSEGCEYYLVKPIDQNKLDSLICEIREAKNLA